HHDAGGGGGRDVDVVNADAGAADHLQALGGGDHVLVRLGGRADGQAVVLVDDLDQLILGQAGLHVDLDAALLEDGDGGGGKFVSDEYAGSHGACPLCVGRTSPVARSAVQIRERRRGVFQPRAGSGGLQFGGEGLEGPVHPGGQGFDVGGIHRRAAPDAQARRGVAVAASVQRHAFLLEQR